MNVATIDNLALNIRRDIIEMIYHAGSGHPGGSLSIADIMAVLYGAIMRVDPTRPDWPLRDRLILSKGHAAPALYAALAESGYYERALLNRLRQLDNPLQGHPDMSKTSGVDMTTGCLGEGLSAGVGMALAGEMQGLDYWTYVVLGDGELQEGQVWAAVMFAVAKRVKRLVAIVDNNGCMCDDHIRDVYGQLPLAALWAAIGFRVFEADGHDVAALYAQFEAIKRELSPAVLIARTIKGKGIGFMEDVPAWHGGIMDEAQYGAACACLKGVNEHGGARRDGGNIDPIGARG